MTGKEIKGRSPRAMYSNGKLVGGQKKLDKNKDGRISGEDFAMMAKGGKVKKGYHKTKGKGKGKGKGTKYMAKGGMAKGKGTKYMAKGGPVKRKGVARGMGAATRGGDYTI